MKIRSLFAATLAMLVGGCSGEQDTAETEPPPALEYTYADEPAAAVAESGPLFEVHPASELGIDFVHETGAAGDKLMPETMGPGCGLFDYDSDGFLDVLFTDGRPWGSTEPRAIARLFRQVEGRFVEVTTDAGLDAVSGYGMGVAVADYDGDGDQDLVVTTVEGLRLLRNDAGVLSDVTAAVGLAFEKPEWATSVAWLDADRDGYLDLFVAYYVQWTPETDLFTTLDGTNKSYATPQVYEGLGNRLYRNLGNGRFEDVSAAAGIDSSDNKALGVVVADIDGNQAPDLFVSNDTVANKLYLNDGSGHFTDQAMLLGVGYDELGEARAGMGVDIGRSGDGAPVVAIGNFSNEAVSLYERLPDGELFIDAAQRRGIATKTLPRLTFGTRFADFDHDGRDDLILANGHIEPEIQAVQSAVPYRQSVDVFLARADGRFDSLAELTGIPLTEPVVGRCVSVGDIDADGDLDALVSVNGGEPLLLFNTVGGARSLLLDLRERGQRAAVGAEVVVSGDGFERRESVRARGSYLGHSPYTLHFGIPPGVGNSIAVHIRWIDGTEEKLGKLQVGHRYRIEHGGEAEIIEKG